MPRKHGPPRPLESSHDARSLDWRGAPEGTSGGPGIYEDGSMTDRGASCPAWTDPNVEEFLRISAQVLRRRAAVPHMKEEP
jgi:hypothetical protein